ncbi:MAG TPA: hypothetical protein PKD90_15625 [Phnomibacter sp.]|nr:hypothetical protein [Phnomibacter sp.]
MLFETWYEKSFLFYFDLSSWIASKLTNKSFEQVVRGKWIA